MSDKLSGEGTEDYVDIDYIEAVAKAATDGPWAVMRDGLGGPCGVIGPEGKWISASAGDIKFIASARQDIPALIGLVRRLQDQIRALEVQLADADDYSCRMAQAYADVIKELRREREDERETCARECDEWAAALEEDAREADGYAVVEYQREIQTVAACADAIRNRNDGDPGCQRLSDEVCAAIKNSDKGGCG